MTLENITIKIDEINLNTFKLLSPSINIFRATKFPTPMYTPGLDNCRQFVFFLKGTVTR